MKKDNNDKKLSNHEERQKIRFRKESEALKANLEKRKQQIKIREEKKSQENKD